MEFWVTILTMIVIGVVGFLLRQSIVMVLMKISKLVYGKKNK